MVKGQEVITGPGSLWRAGWLCLPQPVPHHSEELCNALQHVRSIALKNASGHQVHPISYLLSESHLQRGGRGVWISFTTEQMCFPRKTANRGATEVCLGSGNDLIVGSQTNGQSGPREGPQNHARHPSILPQRVLA